ncbi:hypothetical protein [Soonwooa purpurea]
MKANFIILLILFSSFFKAQEFKIITLKDSIPQNKDYQIFEFINDKTPTENLKFVATISCEGDESSFSNIFEIAKFQSQNLGANSFKYIKKEENGDLLKIYLDIYSSDEQNLIQNRKNEEENKIYIFGSDNLKEKKKRNYKLNGKLKTLPINGFETINYDLGSTLKIAKKDFMSQPAIFKATKNFKSFFLNTDGWGRNESQEGVKDYGIVSVVTYELFYKFDKNLGYTLLKIKE